VKIAYYSPLRPLSSGISDYSEDLLPHLARLAEVTLFVDGFEPTSAAIRERFRVCDFNTTEPAGHDVCLYHMGNNVDFHAGIYRQLCRHPGVVVLHEWVLHNFFAGLTIRRNDQRGYLKEMEYNYGLLGHTLAQQLFRSGVPPVWEVSPMRFPLNRRVIERSLGVIAHSLFVTDRVRAANALVPLARIPHGMAVTPSADVGALRRTHGIPLDRPVVATFGFVNPCKRLDVIARALGTMRNAECEMRNEGTRSAARFLFLVVGRVAGDYDARRVIAEAGLDEVTRFVEPGGLEEFKEFIALADVAVNLRSPTLGETSGAVLRILAAGRPCIVSDVGWFAELPDDCVAKVPPDDPAEVDLVRGYVERLLADADLRHRLGANARAIIASKHAWERAAEAYVTFLDRVVRQPHRHVRADEVIREVARELADMGLPADDDWFVPDVAAELAALCEPVPTPATEADS